MIDPNKRRREIAQSIENQINLHNVTCFLTENWFYLPDMFRRDNVIPVKLSRPTSRSEINLEVTQTAKHLLKLKHNLAD